METTIMENQMEKKMENEMETGIIFSILRPRPASKPHQRNELASLVTKRTCEPQKGSLIDYGPKKGYVGFPALNPKV